ncbi:hypothetical protein QWY85_08985 [Neolewinella lacunae]|uniref:Uncharacterized protein n=1 Tax=Neolewinella lacunae TaxID=1517758 RepID=A0A923PNE0_9BACT|nr:hypothetical protein [Neolewinella lacunae]MBC6996644.1 hypothetical protein [Neolewinella lacunae]MDN3634791.1 hypothetical protein [Neolewinella lacunae]
MFSLQNSTGYRVFLVLLCVLLFATAASAQGKTKPAKNTTAAWDTESAYYKAMAKEIVKLDAMIADAELRRVISALERIARVEVTEALPQYYLAFSYATIAFREKDLDEIDRWCDRSENALAKAEEIGGLAEEELLVVRALVQYGRLQVDYMGRGLESSMQAEKYLRKAYEINPKNPRVLSMLGQHYLKIPAQIGGGREKCCQYAAPAAEAYAAERATFPADIYPIVPHWGELDWLEIAAKYCFYNPVTATNKQP